MASTFVQLPTDGAGKSIHAYTDGSGFYNQAVVLVDTTGTPITVTTSALTVTFASGATVGLAAGANAIGTVAINAAIPAGSNNIGKVDLGGSVSATATRSDVASSASSVTIIAANSNRRGLIITNDSTQVLKIRFGSTAASATDFTYQIGPGQVFELLTGIVYTGQITGIWVSANGNARVTELS